MFTPRVCACETLFSLFCVVVVFCVLFLAGRGAALHEEAQAALVALRGRSRERARARPVQSTIRVPLFAARTLNATGQYRVAVRERKSSLWDTAGGKWAEGNGKEK